MRIGSEGQYETIGVTSLGSSSCDSSSPGIYTRVSKYIPWIKDFLIKSSKN